MDLKVDIGAPQIIKDDEKTPQENVITPTANESTPQATGDNATTPQSPIVRSNEPIIVDNSLGIGGPINAKKGKRERDIDPYASLTARQRVIREILISELEYNASLKVLEYHYAKPIYDGNILAPKHYSVLFSFVQMITHFHEMILQDMLKTEEASIAYVVAAHANAFRCYAPYINGYDSMVQLFNKLMDSNDRFVEVLNEKRKQLGQDIMSLFIMPVQRMPRYELLLRELLKETPESHPEHEAIVLAIDGIHKTNTWINENKRKKENQTKAADIQRIIGGGNVPVIAAPGRKYLKEAHVECFQMTKKFHALTHRLSPAILYLFNDALLWCNGRYQFKGFFKLLTSVIVSKPAVLKHPEYGFQLTDTSRSGFPVVVSCNSEEEAKEWIDDIHTLIREQKHKKKSEFVVDILPGEGDDMNMSDVYDGYNNIAQDMHSDSEESFDEERPPPKFTTTQDPLDWFPDAIQMLDELDKLPRKNSNEVHSPRPRTLTDVDQLKHYQKRLADAKPPIERADDDIMEKARRGRSSTPSKVSPIGTKRKRFSDDTPEKRGRTYSAFISAFNDKTNRIIPTENQLDLDRVIKQVEDFEAETKAQANGKSTNGEREGATSQLRSNIGDSISSKLKEEEKHEVEGDGEDEKMSPIIKPKISRDRAPSTGHIKQIDEYLAEYFMDPELYETLNKLRLEKIDQETMRFGTQKIKIRIILDQLSVRLDSGYESFERYVEKHANNEIERLQLWDAELKRKRAKQSIAQTHVCPQCGWCNKFYDVCQRCGHSESQKTPKRDFFASTPRLKKAFSFFVRRPTVKPKLGSGPHRVRSNSEEHIPRNSATPATSGSMGTMDLIKNVQSGAGDQAILPAQLRSGSTSSSRAQTMPAPDSQLHNNSAFHTMPVVNIQKRNESGKRLSQLLMKSTRTMPRYSNSPQTSIRVPDSSVSQQNKISSSSATSSTQQPSVSTKNSINNVGGGYESSDAGSFDPDEFDLAVEEVKPPKIIPSQLTQSNFASSSTTQIPIKAPPRSSSTTTTATTTSQSSNPSSKFQPKPPQAKVEKKKDPRAQPTPPPQPSQSSALGISLSKASSQNGSTATRAVETVEPNVEPNVGPQPPLLTDEALSSTPSNSGGVLKPAAVPTPIPKTILAESIQPDQPTASEPKPILEPKPKQEQPKMVAEKPQPNQPAEDLPHLEPIVSDVPPLEKAVPKQKEPKVEGQSLPKTRHEGHQPKVEPPAEEKAVAQKTSNETKPAVLEPPVAAKSTKTHEIKNAPQPTKTTSSISQDKKPATAFSGKDATPHQYESFSALKKKSKLNARRVDTRISTDQGAESRGGTDNKTRASITDENTNIRRRRRKKLNIPSIFGGGSGGGSSQSSKSSPKKLFKRSTSGSSGGSTSHSTGKTCAVCRKMILVPGKKNISDVMTTLNCNHSFHTLCLNQILAKYSSCPRCTTDGDTPTTTRNNIPKTSSAGTESKSANLDSSKSSITTPDVPSDDEYLKLAKNGITLIRVPRHGKPKPVTFFLQESRGGKIYFRWDSATKQPSDCRVLLSECELLVGQKTKVFSKHKKLASKMKFSFSVVGPSRTVDVYCEEEKVFNCWLCVLRKFVKSES